MRLRHKAAFLSLLGVTLALGGPAPVQAAAYGHLVQINFLTFYPDTIVTPGDSFSVLVVQNREDAPILHEVASPDLFDPAVLVSVQGTGHIEYEAGKVSRILLDPGEEAVIWFYAAKGRDYVYECNINGHAMRASIRGE
jgi:uncharacterized cupredoxin-like copper-binding protein